MALRQRLCSVVAVPVTPFDDGGGVDEAALRRHLGWLAAHGLDAICLNGNTGEFYSLTPAEQGRVTAAAAEIPPGVLVLAGIGYDVETAIAAGRAAQAAGLPVVMVHQPVQPYLTAEGWVAYHAAIAASLPEVGIVTYLRSLLVGPEAVRELAERCPNFVGVKYAVPDPVRLAAMIEATPPARLAWVCGLAELWAPYFWAAGASGFTSGLVNVAPSLSLDLLSCLRAGEYAQAQALLRRIRPFEAMRARHDGGLNVAVVKEAMAQLGLGSRRVRPPGRELTAPEQAEVVALIANWSPHP